MTTPAPTTYNKAAADKRKRHRQMLKRRREERLTLINNAGDRLQGQRITNLESTTTTEIISSVTPLSIESGKASSPHTEKGVI